jgi:hypothetical protein
VDPSAANPVPCMKLDSSGNWLLKAGHDKEGHGIITI